MFPSHTRNNSARSNRHQPVAAHHGPYSSDDAYHAQDPYYATQQQQQQQYSQYQGVDPSVAQNRTLTPQGAPNPRWEPPANLQAMYVRETGAYVGAEPSPAQYSSASVSPPTYQQPPQPHPQYQRHTAPQQPPSPQTSYSAPDVAHPGQAGYKWTPPLLMQAFQTNADGSPVVMSPPVQQSQPAVQQAPQHPQAARRDLSNPAPTRQVSATTQKFSAFVEWAKSQVVESVESAIANEGFTNLAYDQDMHGQTLLHAVCGTGNLSVLFFLCDTIDGMFDESIFDDEGRLPIHCACEKGYLPIVRFIVHTLGMDPSAPSASGRTPLHYAASGNHVELLEYLLSVEADLTARDSDGLTPFLAAVISGSSTAALVIAQRSSSASLSAADAHGKNAVSLSIIGGHHLILKQLLSLPKMMRPDLNSKCREGKTAMHYAAAAGDFTALHQLLLAGADPSINDANGRSAADYDATGIARFIISGPEKNNAPAPPRYDDTSPPASSPWANVGLRHVARDVSEPSVNGADASSTHRPSDVSHPKSRSYVPPPPNTSFLPPKEPAAPAAWKLKRSKPATPDSADKVSESAAAALERMKARASGGAQPAMPPVVAEKRWSVHGQAAAPVAGEKRWSVHGQNQVGEVHADTGTLYSPPSASPSLVVRKNSVTSEEIRETSTASSSASAFSEQLFKDAREGSIDALENVLGAAPDIKMNVRDIINSTGATLLHVACANGHLATAQYLVEGVGSDVDAVDAHGQTSLHHAMSCEHVLVVRYLVKYCGARLDIIDDNGEDASALSCRLNGSNADEIKKTISKAVSKAPEKRTKVTVPGFTA